MAPRVPMQSVDSTRAGDELDVLTDHRWSSAQRRKHGSCVAGEHDKSHPGPDLMTLSGSIGGSVVLTLIYLASCTPPTSILQGLAFSATGMRSVSTPCSLDSEHISLDLQVERGRVHAR